LVGLPTRHSWAKPALVGRQRSHEEVVEPASAEVADVLAIRATDEVGQLVKDDEGGEFGADGRREETQPQVNAVQPPVRVFVLPALLEETLRRRQGNPGVVPVEIELVDGVDIEQLGVHDDGVEADIGAEQIDMGRALLRRGERCQPEMPVEPVGRGGRQAGRRGPAGDDRLQVPDGSRKRQADDRQGLANLGPEIVVGHRLDDLVQPDDRVLVGLDHAVEDPQLDLLEPADRSVGFRPADSIDCQERHRPTGGTGQRHLVQGILDGADIVRSIAGQGSATDRRADRDRPGKAR
jgi:hypothetical protein